jgi:hypothetical protein
MLEAVGFRAEGGHGSDDPLESLTRSVLQLGELVGIEGGGIERLSGDDADVGDPGQDGEVCRVWRNGQQRVRGAAEELDGAHRVGDAQCFGGCVDVRVVTCSGCLSRGGRLIPSCTPAMASLSAGPLV